MLYGFDIVLIMKYHLWLWYHHLWNIEFFSSTSDKFNISQYILRAMKDSLDLWDDANKVQICSQKDRKEVFWVIWSNIFDILTTQFS